MMNRSEIQKFFLLENDIELFETAIYPRACGGSSEFEQLALYGDRVLDMHLFDYLIESGNLQLKGEITQRKGTIHHWHVIEEFAYDLGIPDILNPLHHPGNKDWKEIVEALIGAAFKVNGLERCSSIIQTFIDFTQKRQITFQECGEFDISRDYISELNNLSTVCNFNKSSLHLNSEGPDHSRTYQFEGAIIFDEIPYEITTKQWSKKKVADNEAAYLALLAITGNNSEYKKFDPTMDNMVASQEKTVYPTTSIDDEKLIFSKPISNNKSMEVNQNTGKSLVDWVNRKAQENVFGMFILLSARLDTVSGASWTCDTSSGVLALINLQLGDEMFFAIGFGPSKTKAREAAGEDMWMKVDLIKWLEKHYPNSTI